MYRPGTSRKPNPRQKKFYMRRRLEYLFISHPSWITAISNTRACQTPRNIQGRSRAPGDNVKEDSGERAVFSEQEAPTSRLTAATFLATMSRLPGMAGAANDAVSAGMLVHMSCRKHPEICDCQDNKSAHKCGQDYHPGDRDNGIRLKNQGFSLIETCTVTHCQDYCGREVDEII